MPRKKMAENGEEIGGEIPPGIVSDTERRALDNIESALEEIGGRDGVAKVQRRNERGKLAWCGQIPVEADFGPDVLQKKWGGGTFYIRFYVGREYIADATLDVEPPAGNATPGNPAAGLADQNTATSIALANLQGKLEGLMEGIRASGGGMGGGGGNVLDMMEKLAGTMRNLMPPAAPGTSIAESLAVVKQIFDLGKEMAPADQVADPTVEIIRDGVKPLVGLAVEEARRRGLAGGGVPRTPNPPAIGTGTAPQAPALLAEPTTGTGEEPMWKVLVRAELPGLLAHAAAGSPPEAVAMIMADQLSKRLPLTVYEQVATWATPEESVATAWQIAVEQFPEIASQEAWGKEFLAALREELVAVDDPPASGAV